MKVIYAAGGKGSRVAKDIGREEVAKSLLPVNLQLHAPIPITNPHIGTIATPLHQQILYYAYHGYRDQEIITREPWTRLFKEHAQYYNTSLGLNINVENLPSPEGCDGPDALKHIRKERSYHDQDCILVYTDSAPLVAMEDIPPLDPTTPAANLLVNRENFVFITSMTMPAGASFEAAMTSFHWQPVIGANFNTLNDFLDATALLTALETRTGLREGEENWNAVWARTLAAKLYCERHTASPECT